jgi:hypothetical protein
VTTSEAQGIVVTVNGDVLLVPLGELFNSRLNVLHAAGLAHNLSGNIGVKAGTVPVTRDRLGVERDLDTELLSNPVEKVPGHPKLVTHRDTLTRANLELPLGRKHLSVDTGDVDTSVDAGLVVSLYNITAVDLAGTDTAIVRTLGTGETTLGPAVGLVIQIEEGVLLLKTKPRLLILVGLHELGAIMAIVELVGSTIGVPALSEDKNVSVAAEGIAVHGNGTKVDVGVLTGSLSGGGTIEVPLGELLNRGRNLVQGPGF